MPMSIRNQSGKKKDVRCDHCDRLLATSEGIKCPRCKKIHSYEEVFATELVPDTYSVVYLWSPDGSQGSTIIIRKEIWLNIGDRIKGVPKGCCQFPVFFIYNYLDPSRACSPDSGCRVNAEPILDFKRALRIARRHEVEARASGKWVETEEIKEPPVERPANGIYTFRDLQRLVLDGKPVTFEDVRDTLNWYADGSAIIARVVIDIIRTLNLKFGQGAELHRLAEKGAANQQRWRERDEWDSLVRAI